MIYELVILGAGPAGITASVYAARKKMDFLVLTKDIGGQTLWSSAIENYIGYQFITGTELVEKFKEHLRQFNVSVKESEEVKRVRKKDSLIEIETSLGSYLAKTVIIATGRIPKRLEVEGEKEYIGRGLTYCATCDAPLFSGKDVAVIGGGNSAFDAALQLTKIAGRIYIIDVADFSRADRILVENAENNEKITFYSKATVRKVLGDKFVTGIIINHGGDTVTLPVEGVFIEIGSKPASEFIENVNKNKFGEIVVDCQARTSVAGIFAAGDVTDVYAKQIIIACGEGAKAALASFEYLTRIAKKTAVTAD